MSTLSSPLFIRLECVKYSVNLLECVVIEIFIIKISKISKVFGCAFLI